MRRFIIAGFISFALVCGSAACGLNGPGGMPNRPSISASPTPTARTTPQQPAPKLPWSFPMRSTKASSTRCEKLTGERAACQDKFLGALDMWGGNLPAYRSSSGYRKLTKRIAPRALNAFGLWACSLAHEGLSNRDTDFIPGMRRRYRPPQVVIGALNDVWTLSNTLCPDIAKTP